MSSVVVLEKTKQSVIATYLQTRSVKETAEQLHYSYSWVYRILYAVGLINVKLKRVNQSFSNLTEKQINEIATDYLSGESTKTILKRHNINSTTLYVLLSQMNLPARYKKRSRSWNQLPKEMQINLSAEVIYLHSQGKALPEISRVLNLPFSRVKIILENLVRLE